MIHHNAQVNRSTAALVVHNAWQIDYPRMAIAAVLACLTDKSDTNRTYRLIELAGLLSYASPDSSNDLLQTIGAPSNDGLQFDERFQSTKSVANVFADPIAFEKRINEWLDKIEEDPLTLEETKTISSSIYALAIDPGDGMETQLINAGLVCPYEED